MDASSIFDEDLVVVGLKDSSIEGTIRRLTSLLRRHGCVSAGYADAVLQRESEFPTGLPTAPFGVALPHADCEHVKRTAIAVGILSQDLKFHLMGSPEDTVDVKVVFLLAIRDPDVLIDVLQGLATMLQKPAVLRQLSRVTSASEVIDILVSEVPEPE